MEIPEMMNHIFAKPAMYLSKPSVEHLQTWIMGYAAGLKIKSLEIEEPVYYGFHDWLVGQFGFGHVYSWSSIISFVGKNESKAFALAEDLWNKYLDETKKVDEVTRIEGNI